MGRILHRVLVSSVPHPRCPDGQLRRNWVSLFAAGRKDALEGFDAVKTPKVDNLRREILGGQSAHWVATYVRPSFRSSSPPSYGHSRQGFRTRLQLRERIVPETPAKWEK